MKPPRFAQYLDKTYHVQIDCLPDEALLLRLRDSVTSDGERLGVRRDTVLRQGTRNAWLEIVLDEGRNRNFRRLLEALNIAVLRLMRVAISSLQLGNLAKDAWRELTPAQVSALSRFPLAQPDFAANLDSCRCSYPA